MMKVFPPTSHNIQAAARVLREVDLVVMPTETVYGLAADASNSLAVAKIFSCKKRPTFNPLICHVISLTAARELAEVNPLAEELAKSFWPGPLTLVLPRKTGAPISDLVTAGLETIAVRVPSHPTALALLEAFGGVLAAPSANPSGCLSATSAEDVRQGFKDHVLEESCMILDGGASLVGLESTILDLTGETPVLLRLGGMALDVLEEKTGPLKQATHGELGGVRAPGQLLRHYAPRHPLRLNAEAVHKEEALLAFGLTFPTGAKATRNLSPTGDLAEAAVNFFAFLHQLDAEDVTGIAVMPIPEVGLGLALNDRLRRGTFK